MRAEGLSEAAIAAFLHSFNELMSGSSGMMSEQSIEGVASLPDLERDIRGANAPDTSLLSKVLFIEAF